ncbi:MaoC dehydratase-like protein [Scopulibacillus darangshiensis]|uniref:MaoC dehydratase-like protein n=1 Tax=Scopulibacillus darangshiensis TaxID=442528 RepID=A0A4V2SNI5_9BACL|nr:MaoC family dehydratase N-terminal domain-containing protein [Scopulibacillus darangshiensis]TCP31326.1 MaoC dehydratase-like protein [Scopulibacillus darangshiensis]
MFEETIGKRSKRCINVVERGAVKKFAEAIGDPHPIYVDRDYGRASRYKNNIAPPTFPRIFDYGTIEGLRLPEAGLIHGSQDFEYNRPLIVGEEIVCFSKVENYYEKSGTSGTLGFLVIKNFGEDSGDNVIFTSTTVIIITEAVRKGLKT